MKIRTLSLLVIVAGVVMLGCHRQAAVTGNSTPQPDESGEKARLPETPRLAAAVDAYARLQNPENDAAVRKAMADVDGEMAELEDLVAKRHGREREKVAARLRHLDAYRSEQTTRFAAIQAGAVLVVPENGEESNDGNTAHRADAAGDR